MACDAQSLINTAYAAGYAKLSARALMEAIVASACAGGGGSGGNAQIVAYTGANPNSDGVKPGNLTSPAIAVKPSAPVYTWNVGTQLWA